MDSNPRSPVSGAVIFWAFYVPVVIGQRPDSCGSREKTHIARIRAVSPSRWDREKPLSSSGESPTNRGAAGELTLAQSVYAPPRAARAPEIGAIRLVRVWHRMFNGGTISGGTG